MDTEGLSVLTAWAAGKFVGDAIGGFIKKSGITEKVKHRRVIIPGAVAAVSGDLEEELGKDWEVKIRPPRGSPYHGLPQNGKLNGRVRGSKGSRGRGTADTEFFPLEPWNPMVKGVKPC